MASSRPVRICFTVDSPYAGGAEHYIALLAEGLDRRLFSTSLLVTDEPGLDAWSAERERNGIPVRRVSMGLPFRPWHAAGVWRALRALSPDIVHVNMPGPYDGQMGLLAPLGRLAGARAVITTEHLPMVERLWKRATLKGVAYRWVDRVLTICDANVPFLEHRQKVPAKRIHVVYNGVPPTDSAGPATRTAARTRYGVADDEIALLFVGSLIERKGMQTLISALSQLGDKRWRLLIAGSGDDEAQFKRQAASSGVGERFVFLGPIHTGEIVELLAAGDVLVLPSFMEGMPYVILEAMAASLPVVATRINGIPEAVEDGVTGRLVPPGDADATRSAIAAVLDNRAMRQQMGQAGLERFQKLFTLEKHLALMQETYVDLLIDRN
jgi:glycosyltransferase involved in cell wall biosynthesis